MPTNLTKIRAKPILNQTRIIVYLIKNLSIKTLLFLIICAHFCSFFVGPSCFQEKKTSFFWMVQTKREDNLKVLLNDAEERLGEIAISPDAVKTDLKEEVIELLNQAKELLELTERVLHYKKYFIFLF